MNKESASFAAGLLIALALEMAAAGPPILVDRQTGKYLGNLSSNPYGRYGSEYSQDSPNNPYATNPPAIMAPPSPGTAIQPLQGF